jgi:hypothetical protein
VDRFFAPLSRWRDPVLRMIGWFLSVPLVLAIVVSLYDIHG